MRPILRRLLPSGARRALRLAWQEAPNRSRDWLADLRDDLAPARLASPPLPPARLRFRVAGNTSRRQFLEVGAMASRDILGAFEKLRIGADQSVRWLDFGCGSGRIARHLIRSPSIRELWGVDVDAPAASWCAKHLSPGKFSTIGTEPPTELPAGHFDVVVSGSVFTHLAEEPQRRWLAEIHRLLRPEGALITCTHSPKLTFMRPDLTAQQHGELERRGFLFAPGGGPFNEDAAFHSRAYLEENWAPRFRLEVFQELGYCGFQDLSAWRKAAATPSGG